MIPYSGADDRVHELQAEEESRRSDKNLLDGVIAIIENWQERDRVKRDGNEGGYTASYCLEQLKKEIQELFKKRGETEKGGGVR